MASQSIKKVAIVGVSPDHAQKIDAVLNQPSPLTYNQVNGNVGKHFVQELLKTGNHEITALTRENGKTSVPPGVKLAPVTYTPDSVSLVSALTGQDFLIITLSASAPPDTHSIIVNAAIKAKVPYIMPNVYGYDMHNTKLYSENLLGPDILSRCTEIEKQGSSSSYIALICGYWYEWSLATGEAWFGFDIPNQKVTFYDDGNTKINVSTWNLCGKAIIALLSLPRSNNDDDVSSTPYSLEHWKNNQLFISSFRISQRDILDSIHRVRGTSDQDWVIKHETSSQRYKDGLEELGKGGGVTGFAKAMYARTFYPNGDGDFESSNGLDNQKLGLEKEDLDEATRRALDMVERGWNPFSL